MDWNINIYLFTITLTLHDCLSDVMRFVAACPTTFQDYRFFDSLFNKLDSHCWRGVLRTNEKYTEACNVSVLLPVGCFWAFVNTQEYDIVVHLCSGP